MNFQQIATRACTQWCVQQILIVWYFRSSTCNPSSFLKSEVMPHSLQWFQRFTQTFFFVASVLPTDRRPASTEEDMLICCPHGRAATSTSLFRFDLAFLLALAVLLCRVTGQVESQTQSPAQVLQDLLSRYGDNSTITVPQLRSLLAALSQGQSESDSGSTAETPTTTPPQFNSSKVQNLFILSILNL